MAQPSEFSSQRNRASSLGKQGEEFVARWLKQQGWAIVSQGWSCRWGELDIVAYHSTLTSHHPVLAFVEVKTRSSGNWDLDGLLSITPAKQSKLWKTAQLFLSDSPQLAELSCRFDVALVTGQRLSHPAVAPAAEPWPPIMLSQPTVYGGYRLTLKTYIESAFTLE